MVHVCLYPHFAGYSVIRGFGCSFKSYLKAIQEKQTGVPDPPESQNTHSSTRMTLSNNKYCRIDTIMVLESFFNE